MRARIFALIILIVLIGIPAGAYYYFTTKQIASIEIHAGTGVVYEAHLSWSFGVDDLALADKALSYTQSCIWVCIFRPVLPARYTIILTASGKLDIDDTIMVNTADTIIRSYIFQKDIVLQSIGRIEDTDSIASWAIWHIRTETGSFVARDDRLFEDIRFTDAIDLSPQIRLGYIDALDTSKLSLANLPLGQSALIRLDRTTGEDIVVKTGLDVRAFFFYRWKPAYTDTSGEIWIISL